jgi:[acyl-carrier-protein] S-malonyltransferase
MAEQGITRMVECGPGKVLSGMNKRIVRELEVFNVQDKASLDATLSALA